MNRTELEAVIAAQLKPLADKQAAHEETIRKYAGIYMPQKSETEQPKQEAGILFARAVKCMALGKGDMERSLKIAQTQMYPEDKTLHAALKAMSVGTPSEGGFLVDEQYSNDLIPLLRSKTAVLELGARIVPMPSGNMNLAKVTSGTTSYYQGENQDATKSQMALGNIKMSSKKLVTLVPISNDLIRCASPAADTMVRDDIVTQMRLKIDYTAMYGLGTVYTPTGIRYAMATANISVSTSAVTADDIGSIIGILMGNNTPMLNLGWIFSGQMWTALYNLKTTTNQYQFRDEMNRGMLNNHPFRVSNQMSTADNTAAATTSAIIFGDFSEFLFGEEMGFEVSTSTEASWYDGTQLQSAFSLDQTVIRVIAKHDMALRHKESFVIYNRAY